MNNGLFLIIMSRRDGTISKFGRPLPNQIIACFPLVCIRWMSTRMEMRFATMTQPLVAHSCSFSVFLIFPHLGNCWKIGVMLLLNLWAGPRDIHFYVNTVTAQCLRRQAETAQTAADHVEFWSTRNDNSKSFAQTRSGLSPTIIHLSFELFQYL